MPRITIPLCVSYDAISRPVTVGVARDVMRVCSIDSNTPVFVAGEFGMTKQPGTEMGATDTVRFESFRRMVVQADDTIRQDAVLNTIVRQNEVPPILEDRILGITVRPVYVQSDITLQFKYVCATRQEAIKWRDEFAVRRAENRGAISHEISYDIPIQDGVLGLMSHLHDLREKTAGYGEDFPTYFQSIQKRPISTVGARDGDPSKLLMVVPEKQVQVTGWFDFTDIPVESKVDGNSTWEIQFQYKVTYHRCVHLYLTYPMMVHQRHISSKYFSKHHRYSFEEVPKSSMIGIRALDVMDGNVDSLPPIRDGIRVPAHDDWITPHRLPTYTIPCITWMIGLNPQDPQDVLDLMDLPDMVLSPEIEAYFKAYHTGLHRRGGTAVLFTLFKGDVPLQEDTIYVTSDLKIRATKPLDLRGQYHLRMSFPTKYSLFVDGAVRGMQLNAVATLQVFQTILNSLDVEWAMAHLLDDRYLSTDYIEWFYRYLEEHDIGFGGSEDGGVRKDPNSQGRTVQYLAIVAKKRV